MLLLFSTFVCRGQVILDDSGEWNLDSEISVFIDSTGEIPANQIRNNPDWFSKAPEGGFRMNDLVGNLWLRVTINNPHNNRERGILILDDPSLYRITLYEEGEKPSLSGTSTAQDERDIRGNHHAFNVSFDPLSTEELYLKVESKNFITAAVTLYDEQSYQDKTRKEYIFLGLFYGVMLLIFVYSIFLYLLTRLQVFLIYGFYIIGNMLFTGMSDGFTPMYLSGFVQFFHGYLDYILAAVSNAIALLFMDRFLNVAGWSERLHKVIRLVIAILLGSLLIILIFAPDAGFELFRPIGLIILLFILFVGATAFRKRVNQSGYFLAAYITFGIFILMFVLNLFRITPFTFLVQYSIHFGILLNLTILSFAIGIRMHRRYENSLREERTAKELITLKNTELEQLVWERTKAIIQKEIELRSILDNSDNLIWLVDSNYIVREMNKGFADSWELTYGVKLKRGKSILEQIRDEDLRYLWLTRYDHVMRGEALSFTESYEINGSDRYFEINAFPIFEDKKVKAAAVFSREITERILYEKQLKDKNTALEKVNQELDSFVYSASHDLKAPLASIQGLIGLVRDEKDESHRLQYYDMMDRSISRLDQFIRDIIDYSRNTRTEHKKEDIGLTEMIESILEDLKYMNPSGSLNVYQHPEGNAPFISDGMRVRIVLRNLLSNALRYGQTEEKQPRIDISWKIEQDKAIIRVKDNGPGIAEEHQHRIFEMFYRAHETAAGSGLGLYIVKETLSKMDGTISVESKEGEGTTFTVELPNYFDGQ